MELVYAVAAWPQDLVLGAQFGLFLIALVAAAAIAARPRELGHTSDRTRSWRIAGGVVLVVTSLLGLASVFAGASMLWSSGSGLKVVGMGTCFLIPGWTAWRAPSGSSA